MILAARRATSQRQATAKKGRGSGAAAFLYLALACLCVGGCDPAGVYRWSGQTMGTTFRVELTQLDATQRRSAELLPAQVDALLQGINESMSTYLEGSEISRFNRMPANNCLAVSDELLALLRSAVQISQRSGGAFNPLVAPLVNRWSFGPVLNSFDFPQPDEISDLLGLVELQHISYSDQPSQICKHHADVQLDLSAIAKGYAVDRIASLLAASNIGSYLVDIGGELKVAGLNSKGKLWRLAIEQPVIGGVAASAIQAVMQLTNKAVATSGDYRNFFEYNGQRYSHTIDPLTGYPVVHSMASVTIIHDSAAIADAWATALLVAGPQKARALAAKHELAVYFIERDQPENQTWHSTYFERYLAP